MSDNPSQTAKRPRVLVLLASYNGSDWINQQIASILAQEDVDVRIAVSDDGSTDDTWAKLSQWVGTGRVTISTRTPPSGSAAQNFLSLISSNSSAGFDFVALSDQDDVWSPLHLRQAIGHLSHSGVDGYTCAVRAFWPTGRQRVFRQSSRVSAADFLFEGCGQGCTCVLTAALYTLVREDLMRHASMTDGLLYHDWAIYALARVRGRRWFFDPEPRVEYRQHGRNDTGARWSWAGVATRLRMLQDGRYARQVRVVARLCAATAPSNPQVRDWLLREGGPGGTFRAVRRASFSMLHGRRRLPDRIITSIAILAGWV